MFARTSCASKSLLLSTFVRSPATAATRAVSGSIVSFAAADNANRSFSTSATGRQGRGKRQAAIAQGYLNEYIKAASMENADEAMRLLGLAAAAAQYVHIKLPSQSGDADKIVPLTAIVPSFHHDESRILDCVLPFNLPSNMDDSCLQDDGCRQELAGGVTKGDYVVSTISHTGTGNQVCSQLSPGDIGVVKGPSTVLGFVCVDFAGMKNVNLCPSQFVNASSEEPPVLTDEDHAQQFCVRQLVFSRQIGHWS